MIFLAAPILFGLVLASVPIIIHLLNRRRFQIVDWAPMKYLKLTIKTNRRRLRIEQLLLLILRTLMIIVLILAVARPVLSRAGIGGWLAARSRSARVIVIDDSLSMAYQQDTKTAFDHARDATTQLIRNIGTQDSLTVFTTSAPTSPLVRDVHLEDSNKLVSLIATLKSTDAHNDWAATLKHADDAINAAPFPSKEVIIVTDLRRSGWSDDVAKISNKWAGANVAMRIIDVGIRQTTNSSLLAFEQEDAIALPGDIINLKALVRNETPASISGAQAVLTIAGEARPVILPDLPPGKVTEVPISINLQKPGQYPLQLKMPGDVLAPDDSRWFCLNVRPTLDVAMIDGEMGNGPFESETDFLGLSFSVGREPWHIQRVSDSDWPSTRLAPSDVMVVANVAQLPPGQVANLEKLVQQGMGLMLFVGDQVDIENWNTRLFKDGNGLLAGKLDRIIDEPVTGLVIDEVAASPLAPMAKLTPAALARIRAKKFMTVNVPAKAEGVRVLAHWNNADSHPAVIEKSFGRGKVILWTITADKAWGDWPIDPTYLLATRSAAMAIARGDRSQDNVAAGQAIQIELQPGENVLEPKIAAPDREGMETVEVTRPQDSGPILRYTRTSSAGPYTLRWKDALGGEQTRLVCVSPDKAESDLDPVSDDQLENFLGNLRPQIVHYSGNEGALMARGQEIWKTLTIIVLCMTAIETVFAVWVGRER
jgi:hypothetical protein